VDIRVEISFTNDFNDKMIGISEVQSKQGTIHTGELDSIIYYVKKALIACGFGEGQVNDALRDSEEI